LLFDVLTHILCRPEAHNFSRLHAEICEGLPVSVD